MKVKPLLCLCLYILFLGGVTLTSAGVLYTEPLSDRVFHVVLDNGFEAILMASHSAPVIASVVIVQTGLRNETRANNGVTHCLEHMLFNGTSSRSQEEIYDAFDRIGAYNNASTSDDYTNYMVMAPKDQIDSAMAIQTDMLFESVFPEEKLEKERGIIIEEMLGNLNRPDYLSELFFKHVAYSNTPFAMPVLGSAQTIRNLTRQQIMTFYRSYYVPNNMRGLFIGDFDREEMIRKIDAEFGRHPAGNLPDVPAIKFHFPEETKVTRTTMRTRTTTIQMLLRAPHFSDPDFYPYWLLTEMMGSEGADGLKAAVNTEPVPMVFRIDAYLDYHPEFSVLCLSVMTSPGANPDQILTRISTYLQASGRRLVTSERLETIRRQMLTSDAADFERPQHYGIVKSQQIAVGGFKFFTEFHDRMAKVQPQELMRVASTYFANPTYQATIVEPARKSEAGMEAIQAHTEKKTLPNGLTIIVQQSDGSDLFALHLLAKNRSALEPANRAGITELLHRMLLTGSQNYSKTELNAALERIGARLKLTDDPGVPFDDYYTSNEYSYLRLECLNDYASIALEMLAEMIKYPALDVKEIETVRTELLILVKQKAESAGEAARHGFYQLLAPNTPLAAPLYGTEASLKNIGRDDLVQWHKRYFSGNNLIISVVSRQSIASVMAQLERLFADLPTAAALTIPAVVLPQTRSLPKSVISVGKPQSQLYLGYVIDGIRPAERAAFLVANAYLSAQVEFELREKQGLAYSIGTSIGFYGDQAIFYARMGTRPENLEKAETGILTEIRKLANKTFNDKELQKIVQQTLGSLRLRQLTRIGQAYYLGLGEFSDNDANYYRHLQEEIQKLTCETVQAASRRLVPDAYVQAVAK